MLLNSQMSSSKAQDGYEYLDFSSAEAPLLGESLMVAENVLFLCVVILMCVCLSHTGAVVFRYKKITHFFKEKEGKKEGKKNNLRRMTLQGHIFS